MRLAFNLTADLAPALAKICGRLDCLPVAIKLSDARVRVPAPDRLLQRIGQRLDALTGGASDRDARQQMLRDAIGWSRDLPSARAAGAVLSATLSSWASHPSSSSPI